MSQKKKKPYNDTGRVVLSRTGTLRFHSRAPPPRFIFSCAVRGRERFVSLSLTGSKNDGRFDLARTTHTKVSRSFSPSSDPCHPRRHKPFPAAAAFAHNAPDPVRYSNNTATDRRLHGDVERLAPHGHTIFQYAVARVRAYTYPFNRGAQTEFSNFVPFSPCPPVDGRQRHSRVFAFTIARARPSPPLPPPSPPRCVVPRTRVPRRQPCASPECVVFLRPALACVCACVRALVCFVSVRPSVRVFVLFISLFVSRCATARPTPEGTAAAATRNHHRPVVQS